MITYRKAAEGRPFLILMTRQGLTPPGAALLFVNIATLAKGVYFLKKGTVNWHIFPLFLRYRPGLFQVFRTMR